MRNKDTRSEQTNLLASSRRALRRRAEEVDREKEASSPKVLALMPPAETQRTLHELRMYQIELEMQNKELLRVQVELQAERERYFDLYDLAPVGYCTISEKGIILESNLTTANMLGVVRGALTKQPILQLIFKMDQDIFFLFTQQLGETGKPQSCELRMVKMDETSFWAHLAATVVQDANGTHVYRVALNDISDRKKKETEIFYLSYHDQLTGLYNRRFYEEELIRLDTERNLPLTIVMGDVNGLKLINDSFGHVMGDELLKKVAEVITKGCRADDIIARLGGDEFVILLPKTNAYETKQIIKRIEALALIEKIKSIDISISFGYEVKKNMHKKIQEIFKKAEEHMYQQKLYKSVSMEKNHASSRNSL